MRSDKAEEAWPCPHASIPVAKSDSRKVKIMYVAIENADVSGMSFFVCDRQHGVVVLFEVVTRTAQEVKCRRRAT